MANYTGKIGIFGGTFNPPHAGHYLLAKEAMKEFGLEQIFFVPSYLPPHKEPRNVIDAAHRSNMVKMLIEDEEKLIFSEYEISQKSVSYTVDTLKYFKTEFPNKELFFLIGTDAFYLIDQWKDSAAVLKMAEFIIFPREYYTKEMIDKKFGNIGNAIFWAHTGLIHISSSTIRVKLKSGEECVKELGSKVSEYVKQHGLYK